MAEEQNKDKYAGGIRYFFRAVVILVIAGSFLAVLIPSNGVRRERGVVIGLTGVIFIICYVRLWLKRIAVNPTASASEIEIKKAAQLGHEDPTLTVTLPKR